MNPGRRWQDILASLAQRHPEACTLRGGARPDDLREMERHVGPGLLKAEPALGELLCYSDGFRVGPYEFYKASGEGIATVTFRTLYAWELNPIWRDRMYFFAAGSLLLDLGVILGQSGTSYVGCVVDSGYKQSHAIPLATDLPTFLQAFLELAAERFSLGDFGPFPPISSWPPDLAWWYRRDRLIAARIAQPGSAFLRGAGGYARQVADAAATSLC